METLEFQHHPGGWVDDAFVEGVKLTMVLELWRQEFHAMFGSLVGVLYPSLANG